MNAHPRRRGHRRASSSTHPVSTPHLVQRTPDLVEASTLSEVAAHAVGVTTPLPGAAPLLAPWPQPCTSSQRHRNRRFTLALARRTTSWAHDRVAGLCWHLSPGPPAPLASSAGRSHAAAHSRRARAPSAAGACSLAPFRACHGRRAPLPCSRRHTSPSRCVVFYESSRSRASRACRRRRSCARLKVSTPATMGCDEFTTDSQPDRGSPPHYP